MKGLEIVIRGREARYYLTSPIRILVGVARYRKSAQDWKLVTRWRKTPTSRGRFLPYKPGTTAAHTEDFVDRYWSDHL